MVGLLKLNSNNKDSVGLASTPVIKVAKGMKAVSTWTGDLGLFQDLFR